MFPTQDEPEGGPDRACWELIAAAAIHVLDLQTGKTRFLYPGLNIEVISTGKYKGFLIGTKDPIIEDRGRTTVYWLLDADGKEVRRIGETEADLARFRESM